MGAPHGTMPGVVAAELVLAQTDRAAVCITRIAAYPTGFEFDVVTLAAPGSESEELLDPMLFGPHHRHARARARGSSMPDEVLRLGIQFADGAKVTNVPGSGSFGDPPSGPVMHSGGGGGGAGRWSQSEWVWPLPPAGPVAFVCEWPAAGIPVSSCELDAQVILDAAARARVIFSDEHLPDRPGWSATRFGPQSS